jgi:hypothetical protein
VAGFFKLKLLKFSPAWGIVAGLVGVHVLLIFLIGMRFVTPYSTDARVIHPPFNRNFRFGHRAHASCAFSRVLGSQVPIIPFFGTYLVSAVRLFETRASVPPYSTAWIACELVTAGRCEW